MRKRIAFECQRLVASRYAARITADEAPSVPVEHITQAIRMLRGQRVLLDAELATLYVVATKRLNEPMGLAGHSPGTSLTRRSPAIRLSPGNCWSRPTADLAVGCFRVVQVIQFIGALLVNSGMLGDR